MILPTTMASSKSRSRTYLLANLVRCAYCGERMWISSSQGRTRYYRDSAKKRNLICANPGAWVRIEDLDAQVDSLMRCLRLPPTWQLQIEEIVRASDERAAIVAEEQRTQEKLRRMNEQYRELEITKAEYQHHRRRLEMQLASLPVLSPSPQAAAGDELERMLKVWEAATLEERSKLVGMIFDAVYVDTEAKEIVAYRPKNPYRALFALCEGLREEAGLLVTQRYEELAGIGDPDRIRTGDLCLDRAVC